MKIHCAAKPPYTRSYTAGGDENALRPQQFSKWFQRYRKHVEVERIIGTVGVGRLFEAAGADAGEIAFYDPIFVPQLVAEIQRSGTARLKTSA